ncbi:PE-PPE domain-containing protein [Mycolicibacterium aichiense]|uniref:PE-PPE domain-containing protein n=1 Tax=Mycolicibacterium aichiense TaxID=1799 RepID=UPI003D667E64
MALRRSVAAIAVALAAAVVGISTPIAIAGTTVLVMGSTGYSLATPPDALSYVEEFVNATVDNYVSPASLKASSGIPVGPYNRVAVITPEEAAPVSGTLTVDESVAQGVAALHSCLTSTVCDYNGELGSVAPSTSDTFVVAGYSQSATIAMVEKACLAAEYAVGEGPVVSFLVTGDAKRPNGGLYARDPAGTLVSMLFAGGKSFAGAAPTNTQYATVDIALQYDGWADFPLNPLNPLAVLNAYMGMLSIHSTYGDHSLDEPGVVDQGQYGDTHYYLISTQTLPLLMPLKKLGPLGNALADTLDPALRVIVESAYDRSISPGVPTAWNIFYVENPIKFTKDFLRAIPVGLGNGIQDLAGYRPFGTQRPNLYGVGGPAVEYTTDESITAVSDSTPDTAAGAAAANGAGSALDQLTKQRPTTAKKTASPPKSASSAGSGKSTHAGVGSSKRAKAS